MSVPLPPTRLIGREADLATAEARLGDGATRLLTLIGPPGVGKTRMALALAQRRVEADPDSTVFVALESVGEAALVPAAIARTLGVRETPTQPLIASLQAALGARRLLLVLDNFEHLVPAAESVSALLSACPALQILVTSRTALRLRAETLLPIEPLALPAFGSKGDSDAAVAAVSRAAAVQLFLARAQAMQPALELRAETAPDIATICARLDGLPLALELAAARCRTFSLRELVERLTARLALLTGGSADLPPRQRTLRAAIAWSYELLGEEERGLLRLLAVFAGGGTLDAIAAVAQEDGAAPESDRVLEALDALIGHSLVRRGEDGDGTSRFRMLETIREFAAERLEAEGEHDDRWLRLTAWSLAFSQLAARALAGREQITWLVRLDVEHDNLRAVLAWTLRSGRAELGLELAGTLWRYWQMRGLLSEGRDWLARLLAHAGSAPGAVRAAALYGAGSLALDAGDLAGGMELAERCLTLYREAGLPGVAEALSLLGRLALRRSQYEAASAYVQESIALAEEAGDDHLIARCLVILGTLALDGGDFLRAREQSLRALALAEAQGDLRTIAVLLNNLGLIADRLDDPAGARAYAERSLALSRRLGNPTEITRTLVLLTMLVRGSGDLQEARGYGEEALALARAGGNSLGVTTALSQLTAIARAQDDHAAAQRYTEENLRLSDAIGYPIQRLSAVTEAAFNAQATGRCARAVRLLAAAEAMREAMGLAQHEGMRRMMEDHLTALRDQLNSDDFARAWAEGLAMSAEAAVAHALAAPPPAEMHPAAAAQGASAASGTARLTRRQVQILGLLASGQSNAEIAAQLVLSERTIEHHVAHIYTKIGVRGRVEATAYALRNGLTG
jgi:predicted ATPase/DNA-binding NarL/FixJ family response regulator